MPGAPRIRGGLFRKYVGLVMAVVSVALIASGGLEIWFSYRENQEHLVRIQREQANNAAGRIEQFIREIENQLGWTTQLSQSAATLEQRRFDALRLLRQVPAVTELSQLDANGREQLSVSRLAMDVIGSQADLSGDPKFTAVAPRRPYYGPVYFRRESEPYMTISVAGTRRDAGVSVAEVNLKFIWDVVSQIKVGESGAAYVVDSRGRLIAHPDISRVLRNTDLSGLPQIRAAREQDGARGASPAAVDMSGQEVVTAHAAIPALDWLVFVELPLAEALAPLIRSAARTGILLLLGLAVAFLAGLFFVRRMVGPIQALRSGAAEIGGGHLDRRIAVSTGDELEALAAQFNDMAGRLQESYADLERKVEARTEALARSVEELRALGEVSQAVNSSLDLSKVLETIVARAVQLSGTEAGGIYVFSKAQQSFKLRASYGIDAALAVELRRIRIGLGETEIGEAGQRREAVQVPDIQALPASPIHDVLAGSGFRALLVVPLLRPDHVVGALVIRRRAPGAFPPQIVDLLTTFAAQSVLAIQNARLFSEIEEKSRLIEIASQHKSQFLANMSHELRTPLNAILGYTELILDGIYGETSAKLAGVLERVQSNGKHLLGLINDVLDLSRIEAGQLNLTVDESAVGAIVQSVIAATESLASGKGLELSARVEEELPLGLGDERRLTQVLLNLVGNAIKFTDSGAVEIVGTLAGDRFRIAVRDTGPGIAPEDQRRIFDEFQQVDNSSTRKKGGSGLGLAISRRIVELHGGTIGVDSVPGVGSTFTIEIPVRVADAREAA